MARAQLTDEEIAEIEAVNNEQAASLDAAMNKMRAGVPDAVTHIRRPGRPTNEEKLRRAQAAGVALAPIPMDEVPPLIPRDPVGRGVRASRFEIDDDVPLPEDTGPSNGLSYPWQKLDVGQSFFIPEDGRKNRSKLTSMYSAHRRYPGRRFKAYWQEKDVKRGISGFRVWRVA